MPFLKKNGTKNNASAEFSKIKHIKKAPSLATGTRHRGLAHKKND